MSDALTDNQHRDIFILANLLISSVNREEVTKNIQLISRHVKEHVKEHHVMLQKLAEIDYKILHIEIRRLGPTAHLVPFAWMMMPVDILKTDACPMPLFSPPMIKASICPNQH
jgi:hemerythrin